MAANDGRPTDPNTDEATPRSSTLLAPRAPPTDVPWST